MTSPDFNFSLYGWPPPISIQPSLYSPISSQVFDVSFTCNIHFMAHVETVIVMSIVLWLRPHFSQLCVQRMKGKFFLFSLRQGWHTHTHSPNRSLAIVRPCEIYASIINRLPKELGNYSNNRERGVIEGGCCLEHCWHVSTYGWVLCVLSACKCFLLTARVCFRRL